MIALVDSRCQVVVKGARHRGVPVLKAEGKWYGIG